MFSRVNILTTMLNIMKKFLNSKLVIMRKYQNTKKKKKMRRATPQIDLRKSLLPRKQKNIVWWTRAIIDLKGDEIFGKFYENELQKTCQKELRIEKVI